LELVQQKKHKLPDLKKINMSNFSLPQSGTVFAPVAKFLPKISYDINKNPLVYKVDLDLKKVGLSSDFLKNLMSNDALKDIDIRLVIYIFLKLEKDADVVTLNPTIIARYVKWRRSSISASLNRLCSAKYIMPLTGKGSGRCNYQVNVLSFFCGNRIEFLEQINPKLIKRI
jgi:hypothetical protein